MNFLSDVITYVRRIIKSPSDAVITDALIIDYINRFWIMDVDARLQLFDLKTKFSFQTTPGVDQYNMPLYTVQTETTNPDQTIGIFPVYQGFEGPCYVNGIEIPFYTQKNQFFRTYPNVVQNFQSIILGDGTNGPYTINFPILPNTSPPFNPPINALIRGHVNILGIMAAFQETGVYMDPTITDSAGASNLIPNIPTTSVFPGVYFTSIDSTGANVIVSDSGLFLLGNVNYGLLMTPGQAPYGNTVLGGGYDINTNTINYLSGKANVFFPVPIPSGNTISGQCFFFQSGLPRGVLFYDNILTLRSVPDRQYLVELDAYLSPAAFFSTTQAIPFAYMTEYIARGAARKILSDTGDVEQFAFYEPLFREQEILVWKRSQRQFTATRTETIYSQGIGGYYANYNISVQQ
jgi:hypothetical protein